MIFMNMHLPKTIKKFCVYVDYTTSGTIRPYYVGKGTNSRIKKSRRNPLHSSIRKRFGLERRVEFETDDSTEAYNKEIELIALYKTFYGDNCDGANLDRGGQGGPSTPKSEEHKEKIRLALLGKKKTPEHCNAMSAGGKGKVLSEEHKEKLKISSKEASKRPEVREAKRRGAIKANAVRWSKPLTDEQRKKFSDSAKRSAARRKREREEANASSLSRGTSLADQTATAICESSGSEVPDIVTGSHSDTNK